MTVRRSLATLLIVLFSLGPTLAQEGTSLAPPTTSLTITAASSHGRVRFTAPAQVVQMHLEIYSEAGEKLFDTVQAGNVLDYLTLDKAGEQLPDAAYLCVVTVKTVSGKLSQKIGTLLMQGQQVSVRLGPAQPTPAQAQAVGPVEENSALTVLREGDTPAATVITHDGQNGQVTSTTGALTFRTGDIFAGKDTEQMRLTTAGNLGIGTDNPEARLDVNGMIRARAGFQFADGSVLNLAPKGGLRVTLPSGATMPVQVAPAAPSTLNRLPKFIDGGSSLGDSALFESNGFIGWGTTTPAHPLTVQRNGGSAGVHSFGELYVSRDDRTRSASMILGTGGQLKWIFGMPYQDDGFQVFDLQASPAPGVSRFYVHPTSGNIGIGTNSPTYKLDVAGTLRGVQNVSNDMVVQTTGGTNAWARMWMITPSQRWTFGTSQNFNGNQLYLSDDTFGQTRMTVQPNGGTIAFPLGNIGIGTSSPTAKLHVLNTATQPGIYSESPNRGVWGVSTGSSYGVYGESVNGIGMQGVSTANIGVVGSTAAGSNVPGVYGVSGGTNGVGVLGEANTGNASGVHGRSTSGTGVRGDSTGSTGYGVFGQNLSGGMAIKADGDATQSLTNGGFVKAMIHVNADGSIARCYNSQLIGNVPATGTPRASTVPCNFTVTREISGGDYTIRFGFRVNDRFYSLAIGGGGGLFPAAQVLNYDQSPFIGVNELRVLIYEGNGDGYVNSTFTLIVY